MTPRSICDIKDVPNYENVLSVELCKITNWLAANKLSLIVGKTKFTIFHSDKKKVVYPKLLINNIEIERVDYFNFFFWTTIESQLKLEYACKLCIIENIKNFWHNLETEI